MDRHPPEEREQEVPRTVSPEDAAAAARELHRTFGVLLEYWLQQQQQQQQQAAGTAYSGDAPRGQTVNPCPPPRPCSPPPTGMPATGMHEAAVPGQARSAPAANECSPVHGTVCGIGGFFMPTPVQPAAAFPRPTAASAAAAASAAPPRQPSTSRAPSGEPAHTAGAGAAPAEADAANPDAPGGAHSRKRNKRNRNDWSPTLTVMSPPHCRAPACPPPPRLLRPLTTCERLLGAGALTEQDHAWHVQDRR